MKTMFLIADFCAEYPGNFIASLIALEQTLSSQYKTIYFFRKGDTPGFKNWFVSFSQRRECYLISFDKNGCKKTCELVKTIKPSCLYFHFGGLLFPYMVYRRLNCEEKKAIKLIFHAHSKPNQGKGLKPRLKHLMSRLLCPKELVFIACSEEIEQILQREHPRNKKYLILNKIDFSRLTFSPGKKANPDKSMTALTFCYDYYVKGGDIAAAIAKQLHEKFSNFRLLMVVARNEEKIKKQLAKDFPDYKNYIEILPPSSDVSSLYDLSTIYLLPSRTEGFSYARVEASYSGLCLICSDLPALRDADLPRLSLFPIGAVDTAANLIEKYFFSAPKLTKKSDYEAYDLTSWANEEAKALKEIIDA